MIRNVPSSTRAHPRSRGENPGSVLRLGLGKGSSPLTRGKPHRVRGLQARVGLIPAHAGKTSDVDIAAGSCWAHPRSRGENDLPRADRALGRGSSPLTRGKRGRGDDTGDLERLIPAHAGKTSQRTAKPCAGRAHPRSRGENVARSRARRARSGSSPLTRGKRTRAFTPLVAGGLIPAHAGKTSSADPNATTATAHPRSRGENHATWVRMGTLTGSSPLTRGKHFLTCAFIAQIGQILESLELCASSETYSLKDVSAIDSLRDRVRSIGLDPLNSTGTSSA